MNESFSKLHALETLPPLSKHQDVRQEGGEMSVFSAATVPTTSPATSTMERVPMAAKTTTTAEIAPTVSVCKRNDFCDLFNIFYFNCSIACKAKMVPQNKLNFKTSPPLTLSHPPLRRLLLPL